MNRNKKINSHDLEQMTPGLSKLALAVRTSIIGLGLASGVSQAATIEVDTNGDGNVDGCTLRQAIETFNSNDIEIGADSTSITETEAGFIILSCFIDESSEALGVNDTITFSTTLPSNTIQLLPGDIDGPGEIDGPLILDNTLDLGIIEGPGDIEGPGGQDGLIVTNNIFIDASNIDGGITIDAGGTSRIFIVNNTSLTINNLNLTNGDAFDGAGMLILSSDVTLINSTVFNNNAFLGGGITAVNSSLSLNNSTISGNISGSGAGIYADFSSDVTLNSSTVTGNSISGELSIPYIPFFGLDGNGPTTENGLLIEDPIEPMPIEPIGPIGGPGPGLSGGGILVANNSSVTLVDSTVSDNSADIGGGIHATNGSSVTLNNSTVSGNSASVSYNSYNQQDSVNIPSSESGYIDFGNPYQSLIESGSGAGIAVSNSSTLTLDSSTVSGNVASSDEDDGEAIGGYGGGIAVAAYSNATLNNSTISNNIAQSGGGVRVDYYSSITFNNSTLSENDAGFSSDSIGSGGGAVQINNSSAKLINSTISGNSAYQGGAIASNNNAIITLNNSTISGNSANYNGGLYAYSSSITISNSIIANSEQGSSYGPGLYCQPFGVTFNIDSASIVDDSSCGIEIGASRTQDPDLGPLADNGGLTQTHGLSANSIARNTGVAAGAVQPLENCTDFDQRGQLRIDGDEDGCDVGAIEFNPNDNMGDNAGFKVIPLGNGKVVVIPL